MAGRHAPERQLLLPLIRSYRHAIELTWKEAIRQAAASPAADCRGESVVWAEQIDEQLKRRQRHRLGHSPSGSTSFLRRLDECAREVGKPLLFEALSIRTDARLDGGQ